MYKQAKVALDSLNLKSDCLRSLFQHNVVLYFKVSDENRRELLGDILHQIRFPTMTLDKFLHNVSNTEVLTDREVRGIVTVIGGAKPNVPVTFPDKPRGRMFEEIQFTEIEQIRKINVQLPLGVFCDIKLEGLDAGEILEVSEIHFCNPADFPYDVVQTHGCHGITASKILKIPNQMIGSAPVYKAIFNRPIKLSSNFARVHLKTSTYSGTAPSAYITGRSSNVSVKLNDKSIKIKLGLDTVALASTSTDYCHLSIAHETDPRNWWFLLGMKGRIVKT